MNTRYVGTAFFRSAPAVLDTMRDGDTLVILERFALETVETSTLKSEEGSVLVFDPLDSVCSVLDANECKRRASRTGVRVERIGHLFRVTPVHV